MSVAIMPTILMLVSRLLGGESFKGYRAIGKSVKSPGSYSIVVRAPVDPGTNRAATPFFSLEELTILWVLSVMSRISPSRWVRNLNS